MTGVRLLEMQRSENWSFCCGAGGGRFWSKDASENLIAANRLQQVNATGASILCTACPYCKLLLEKNAARQGLPELQILDIAEILEKAVQK
ncbi:MAG: succinate dehydrogenase/fumarate reductase iron-sulfur subunit [Firmicutes bacterium ADurb.Bin373]|nr:MAG: succinate dehydrogenase/fumarate reductase iron-sulfur subunit [Firmicutes bacterium ADurb.Bin373]